MEAVGQRGGDYHYPSSQLVVIPGLQKIDALVAHLVNDAVLLVKYLHAPHNPHSLHLRG